jgi:hypothetical protein
MTGGGVSTLIVTSPGVEPQRGRRIVIEVRMSQNFGVDLLDATPSQQRQLDLCQQCVRSGRAVHRTTLSPGNERFPLGPCCGETNLARATTAWVEMGNAAELVW